MDARRTTAARTVRTAGTAAALAVLVLLAGCARLTGDDAGPTTATARPVGATEVLSTQEWGEVDGLVSVLVRNDGDRTLRRATAVLTAIDDHGRTLASSAAQSARGDCCTVLDLPPGTTYGLYFDTRVDPASIADVEVSYRDIAWNWQDDATPVEAAAVELRRTPDNTVVVADVTPTGTVDGATVQALLADADGTFLAVVSGRWRCFAADRANRIVMELRHAVPAGTTVTGVQALPIHPPNAVTGDADRAAPAAVSCADGP